MKLPITPDYAPMEAESVEELPVGPEWQYEPKWDGFRCLAFRDGDEVELRSKAGQPLGRYFPEVVAMLRELEPRRFVLDGELAIPTKGSLSFDDLLLRIHPAVSRIKKLASETPAMFIVFDLLVDARGRDLTARPRRERRAALEELARTAFPRHEMLRLSPVTDEAGIARKWFQASGDSLDGIVAKRLDLPYLSGERAGMRKVKRLRTVECVVGGFRYASKAKIVGSLLIGLYDDDGVLHHVGFTSSLKAEERKKLTPKLEKLIGPPGFTGRAPGGPSRWSTKRSSEWQPLRPELVVEVQYDHFSGGRFRHGTKFLRWRPDKGPRQCTMDQVVRRRGSVLGVLDESRRSGSVRRRSTSRSAAAKGATGGRL